MLEALIGFAVGNVLKANAMYNWIEGSIATNKGNLYPTTMECVEIDNEKQEAICEDAYGQLWSFVCDDAEVGDYYSIIMNDNGTNEIEDDIIISVRYYK